MLQKLQNFFLEWCHQPVSIGCISGRYLCKLALMGNSTNKTKKHGTQNKNNNKKQNMKQNKTRHRTKQKTTHETKHETQKTNKQNIFIKPPSNCL